MVWEGVSTGGFTIEWRHWILYGSMSAVRLYFMSPIRLLLPYLASVYGAVKPES